MKILIYTQAYNSEKVISSAIESIMRQTNGNWEYHLLENGSTDSTRKIIDHYAKLDARIVPHYVKKNDPFIYREFWKTLLKDNPDAAYFAHLDSDDEYKPDFIEQMLTFMTDNHLDCAACGTQLIDLETGAFIYERVLKEDMIIEGNKFSDEFLTYRRHYMQVWGKIFKTTLMKKYYDKVERGITRYPGIIDFEMTLGFLANAKRAGILAKTLHTFSQHPNSLTRTCFEGIDQHLTDWINIIREHLLLFGPISQINQEYLYAIYLGQLKDVLEVIYRLDLSFAEKLHLITDIFKLSDTEEMLECKVGPQFSNLATRSDFLKSVENWIITQDEYEKNMNCAEKIVLMLRGVKIQ